MKKLFYFVIAIIILFPLKNVNALSCYNKVIDVNNTHNFPCSNLEGESITFKHNDKDYSEFFTTSINGTNLTIDINSNISFDTNIEVGIVVISDGVNSTTIQVKNPNYIKPTEAQTTTTTTSANTKTYNVTLDLNGREGENIIKTCAVTGTNETCSITLPNLEDESFNGWGTAATCKEGSIGTIKVEKDITYYACSKSNENEVTQETDNLYLKSLILTDKDTNETIDFGIFSIRKTEYDFEVLYNIENINIEAVAEEADSKIEISGNENLAVGENKIIIKLSKDDKVTEYILNVNRLKEGQIIDKNHYLSSLVIGGYNINFKSDIFNYTVTIDSSINKLEITALPLTEGDEVEILNDSDLVNGSIIEINVIGEDKSTTKYQINIVKKSSNLLLFSAIGVILFLIVILIIIIILKSKKRNNNKVNKKTNKKNKKNNTPEVLPNNKVEEEIEVLKF